MVWCIICSGGDDAAMGSTEYSAIQLVSNGPENDPAAAWEWR